MRTAIKEYSMIVIFPGLFLAKRRTMDGICCLQPEVQNLRQGLCQRLTVADVPFLTLQRLPI
jgi:hypothetical protein